MKKFILLLFVIFSIKVIAQTAIPIQEFNFNGTLSNTKKDITFSGIARFVNGRTGLANSAQRLINEFLEISITNLPLDNSPRTVSIWVKFNDITNANYIWGYGSFSNAQFFGLLQQSTTTSKSDLNLASWGPANDVIVTTALSPNTWYNYVVTYDGLTSKIYRNGELIKSAANPKKATTGNIFCLGKMSSGISINADIDDLKIYDVALSLEDVQEIYYLTPSLAPNDNLVVTPASNNENLGKGEKPAIKAPIAAANTIANNSAIGTNNIRTTEIFTTEGKKIMTSNKPEINTGTLSEGTYLLKISNSTSTTNK